MSRIVGDRIYLRPITLEDTDLIVKWRNKKLVQDNFIFRYQFTAEMHENWMNTKVHSGEVVQYIICTTEDIPIGSVYFRDIDLKKKCAEFGIFIGEEKAIGKGFGKDATITFVKYGFEVLGFDKIILRVINTNVRATSVYEKAGFEKMYEEKEISKPSGEEINVIFMEIKKEKGV